MALLIIMMITGIFTGVSPAILQAYGAGHNGRVGKIMRQGLWLALILTAPGMLFLSHLDTLMLKWWQAPTIVNSANSYLDSMLWGLFPALGFAVLRSLVCSISQPPPVMLIVIVATIFKTIGNYTLAFGKFGFPKMELVGLATASAIAHCLMFVFLLIYVLGHKSLNRFQLFQNFHKIDPKILWELVWVGFPIGILAII